MRKLSVNKLVKTYTSAVPFVVFEHNYHELFLGKSGGNYMEAIPHFFQLSNVFDEASPNADVASGGL